MQIVICCVLIVTFWAEIAIIQALIVVCWALIVTFWVHIVTV